MEGKNATQIILDDSRPRTRSHTSSSKADKMAGVEEGNQNLGTPSFTPFKMEQQQKPASENDWWMLFQSLGQALNGIQEELSEMRVTKGKVDTLNSRFTESWKTEVDDKIQILELCDRDKDYQIKLLSKMVIRQDEKIQELQAKSDAAYRREIRANLIISGW